MDLGAGVAEVERHGNGARLEDTEVDGQPLEAVVEQDGDLVALADAAREQQVGEAIGLLVEHAPGDLAAVGLGVGGVDEVEIAPRDAEGLLDLGIDLDEGDLVGIERDVLAEHLDDGHRRHGLGHGDPFEDGGAPNRIAQAMSELLFCNRVDKGAGLLVLGTAAQALDLGITALLGQAARHRCLGGMRVHADLGLLRASLELRTDLLEAELAVAELAALLAAHRDDASGDVAHANGGIRRVDALSTRAGRMERLGLALLRELLERERRELGVLMVCELHVLHADNGSAGDWHGEAPFLAQGALFPRFFDAESPSGDYRAKVAAL